VIVVRVITLYVAIVSWSSYLCKIKIVFPGVTLALSWLLTN